MTAKPSQFATGYQQALSDMLDAIAPEATTHDRLAATLRYIADNSTDTGTRDTARWMENAMDMAVRTAALDALEAGK